MNRSLIFFVALLLLFLGGSLVYFGSQREQPPGDSVAELDPEYVAPEPEMESFEFTDQLAKPFSSKELEGRIWMGSFFFADCPTICKQQNEEIAKIHRRFRDDDVTILNITVTPDRDPPHKLFLYANNFGADHEKWKFLTGKKINYVVEVGAEFFNLTAANETHSSEVVLFNQSGEMLDSYNVNDAQEYAALVTAVEGLLGEEDSSAGNSVAEEEDATTGVES